MSLFNNNAIGDSLTEGSVCVLICVFRAKLYRSTFLCGNVSAKTRARHFYFYHSPILALEFFLT